MIEYIVILAIGIIATIIDSLSTIKGLKIGCIEMNQITSWFHNKFGLVKGQLIKTSLINIPFITFLVFIVYRDNMNAWILGMFYSGFLGFAIRQYMMSINLKGKEERAIKFLEKIGYKIIEGEKND